MTRELTTLEKQVIDVQVDFLKLENANYRSDIQKIIITFVLIILALVGLFVGAFFYQQAGFLNFLGGYNIENGIATNPIENGVVNNAKTYGQNSNITSTLQNVNINTGKLDK